MSKKFKSQASSARAASTLPGGFGLGSSFQTTSSPLSYVSEQPDLSQISEPNIVVAFKNLGKKDSTTKAKALEELQEHCSHDTEQAILQAWADIYPRTSIDNSRKVRQLAHTFQGNLTASTGKRIAPLLPKVIGSWLAGTFDSDKSVSRSAQDALERSFPTPEKRKALWNVYKDSIFEYIEDAITVQTSATLSDERTTSVDDAQAKYVRVIGTSMNILAYLLSQSIQNDQILSMLSGKTLWEFAYYDDPYLRRGACELIITASEKHGALLDWQLVSTCFLSKGLNVPQIGSSKLYSEALVILTRHRPDLWITDYTAKTPILKRLLQYLKRGSQNGPESVWSNITILVRTIPEQVWCAGDQITNATNVAEALRTGVIQPTERANAASAWASYVQTCSWLMEKLATDKDNFAHQNLVPIVNQYVTRTEEQHWSITTRATQICRGVLLSIIKQDAIAVFDSTWTNLYKSTIEKMKLSQPEVSKDYKSSQENIIDQAKRLYSVKSEMIRAGNVSAIQQTLDGADLELLEAAIQLLNSRNGKPYGVAGVVDIVVGQPGFDNNNAIVQFFLTNDLPNLINTPSSQRIASVALKCGHTKIIEQLLRQRSDHAEDALCYVLASARLDDSKVEIKDGVLNRKVEDAFDRKILSAAMCNSSLESLHTPICKKIAQSLTNTASEESQDGALTLLELLVSTGNAANSIMLDENRSLLLPNLLFLADTGSQLSERANAVVAHISSGARIGLGSTPIIRQQLEGQGAPLSILTLIDLAEDIVKQPDANLNEIMPTSDMWQQALSPHLSSTRPCSLAVTSPLEGVLYVLEPELQTKEAQLDRDQDDFALIFRLVLYVTKLLSTADIISRLDQDHQQALFQNYPLAIQLVNEKLTLEDANEIWTQSTPEVIQEASDMLSEGNKLIQSCIKNESFSTYWLEVLHNLKGADSRTYVTALTCMNIVSQYLETVGPSRTLQEFEQELKTVYKSTHLVQSAAVLSVSREYLLSSAQGKKVLNELVANATEMKEDNARSLILLNVMLQGNADALEVLPTQRIVFLLKNLVHLLEESRIHVVRAEAMVCLSSLLPQVQDIYGEHWEKVITAMLDVWSTDVDLPTIHASLRLYAKLKDLVKLEDVNEDLQEAWKSNKAILDNGVLECLRQLDEGALSIDQPRTITVNLVRRLLQGAEIDHDEYLISHLVSPIEDVQTATYEILHRTIPQEQEQLSLDFALTQAEPELSRELLSLLKSGSSGDRLYLLAWELFFDHYPKASYKLREAYSAELKSLAYINDLLTRICEIVKIVDSRPVDASKFNVMSFEADQSETPEKEIQWLAIHNYHQALLYVPGLVKDWYISQKNRVKSPLETWTQRYISPAIITASLSTVTDWAGSQSQDEEDRPLIIKSSPRSSEITATITIDPESPPVSLAISLPGSYPLESPAVNSRARVGVSEKNWQSWLRTIQIIILSTGSIIEGLIAFRRNVYGALKGHTECAICYSIIGTDMETPSKKCGTCKNVFHGSCLFRWFKSSNSSSCPLCRNNFNYA